MTASVFESFNAKNLAPFQVARTFIPPPQFDELCGRSHAVVVGPRGSGKTTLLKMLQAPSLARWEHPDAEYYRSRVDFAGVFIGADIVWREQMESLAAGKLAPDIQADIAVATFTTQVFISLLSAFEEMIGQEGQTPASMMRLKAKLSVSDEATLIRILSDVWQVRHEIPSFLGLKLALRARLGRIADWVNEFRRFSPDQVRAELSAHRWVSLSFYENCLTAIEAMNGLIGRRDFTWAFLFDELEIAPDPIRVRLLTLLRGTDSRVLLKLSVSPFNSDFSTFSDEQGAKPGHDYLPIPLWYSEKEEAAPFAEALATSILEDAGASGVSLVSVFGTSEFDAGRAEQQEQRNAYAPGSSNFRRFSDLAARDSSFAEYLRSHQIDLKSMHLVDDINRASQLRKITSVVTVREAYLRTFEPKSGQRVRSRKRPTLFSGASALLAVTEGNPRWIIGTLGPLLKQYASDRKTVKRVDQTKTVMVAVERYRALLSTVPLNDQGGRSLLSLIDELGRRFHHNVVLAPFTPEPATSFRVSPGMPSEVLAALEVALNVGAIVFVPDNPGETVVDTIEGKRFRLTYLLAPYHKVPPTIGKERSLLSLLRDPQAWPVMHDLFAGAMGDA